MKINIQNNDFGLTLYLNKKTTKKIAYVLLGAFYLCIYNHRTTKTNQKYPSVNL